MAGDGWRWHVVMGNGSNYAVSAFYNVPARMGVIVPVTQSITNTAITWIVINST